MFVAPRMVVLPDAAVRSGAARQLSPLGQFGQHSHFMPWGCRDFRRTSDAHRPDRKCIRNDIGCFLHGCFCSWMKSVKHSHSKMGDASVLNLRCLFQSPEAQMTAGKNARNPRDIQFRIVTCVVVSTYRDGL